MAIRRRYLPRVGTVHDADKLNRSMRSSGWRKTSAMVSPRTGIIVYNWVSGDDVVVITTKSFGQPKRINRGSRVGQHRYYSQVISVKKGKRSK